MVKGREERKGRGKRRRGNTHFGKPLPDFMRYVVLTRVRGDQRDFKTDGGEKGKGRKMRDRPFFPSLFK